MKGLEILVMHYQEEEEKIENDISYHVGVTKCSEHVSGFVRRPPDFQAKRLTTGPSSGHQLVGNPGRNTLITNATVPILNSKTHVSVHWRVPLTLCFQAESLVDVSLAAEGRHLQAHKVNIKLT